MPPPRVPSHAPPRLDAANVAGLTGLMNTQHVRGDVQLRDAESAVLGKRPERSGGRSAPATDPTQIYHDEINALARDLGIDFADPAAPTDGAGRAPGPGAALAAGAWRDSHASSGGGRHASSGGRHAPPSGGRHAQSHGRRGSSGSSGGSSSGDTSGESSSGSGSGSSYGSSGSESGSGSSYTGSESGSSYTGSSGSESGSGSSYTSGSDAGGAVDALGRDLGIGRRHRGRDRVPARAATDFPADRRRHGHDRDHGRDRGAQIDDVLGAMRGAAGATARGLETERLRDIKAERLEHIAQLVLTLEEEGIDCSSVARPGISSDLSEIDSVLNVLRLKNDRNRYSTIAEEVIIGAAEAISTVFDGTRTIPVLGWKPDYTGYPATVNVKMHRMRYETSQVVGGIVEKYQFGPTTRIIFELLPSLLLYPRTQRRQRSEPALGAETAGAADPRNAFSAIRDADNRDSSLDTIEALRRV